MYKIKHPFHIVIIAFLLGTSGIFAQLRLYPTKLEFKDSWHRLQNISLVNAGSQPVTIDSIYYKSRINYSSNFYLTRFNKYGDFPFTLNPGDSVIMDCILSGYFSITSKDTVDTMLIATSFETMEIGIKIDFLKGNFYGEINGQISDGQTPLDSANVMFFYNGDFLYKAINAQTNGSYSAELPPGDYTIAVERPGYPLTFYNQQTDPYCAKRVTIEDSSTAQIDFDLTKLGQSGYTLSGHVIDMPSRALLRRGIIVVRRGTHTPSKRNKRLSTDEYSGMINPDGSFEIPNIAAGTYMVQSISSYYVPTYYTRKGTKGTFWQQADTLVIDKDIQNTTIEMPRDSSIGGGTISGKILSSDSSFDFCGVTIYAYSLASSDTMIYSYTFADDSGSFKISGLPVGSYKLMAQKIGYPNALSSSTLTLGPGMQAITGVNLYFTQLAYMHDPLPPTPQLYQNYPNPFNPTTTIEFYIVRNSNVTLKITNILGQNVAVLHQGFLPAGDYSFRFNGANYASGVYLVSLITDNLIQTKKMMLLK